MKAEAETSQPSVASAEPLGESEQEEFDKISPPQMLYNWATKVAWPSNFHSTNKRKDIPCRNDRF